MRHLAPRSSLLSPARQGFTLIEIIIVVGITTVLAGMILTYTSTSRDQVALYVEEAKLAQTIARAKSLAITTFNQPQLPCAYGVHLDYENQAYALFSYTVPQCRFDQTLDLSALDGDCGAGAACRLDLQYLPPNILVTNEGDAPIQDILFVPPEPKTWVWEEGKLATSTSGEVYLRTHGTDRVTVSVSQAGQISF